MHQSLVDMRSDVRPHTLLLFVIGNACLTLRFLLGTVAFMIHCLKHMEIKQNVVYIM